MTTQEYAAYLNRLIKQFRPFLRKLGKGRKFYRVADSGGWLFAREFYSIAKPGKTVLNPSSYGYKIITVPTVAAPNKEGISYHKAYNFHFRLEGGKFVSQGTNSIYIPFDRSNLKRCWEYNNEFIPKQSEDKFEGYVDFITTSRQEAADALAGVHGKFPQLKLTGGFTQTLLGEAK